MENMQMAALIDEFTDLHNSYLMAWATAMRTGNTSVLEEVYGEQYFVVFYEEENANPNIIDRDSAISGMRDSIDSHSDAEKLFENRLIRLRDSTHAIVFYEQVIVKNGKVKTRLFTTENWEVQNEQWRIYRETVEPAGNFQEVGL